MLLKARCRRSKPCNRSGSDFFEGLPIVGNHDTVGIQLLSNLYMMANEYMKNKTLIYAKASSSGKIAFAKVNILPAAGEETEPPTLLNNSEIVGVLFRKSIKDCMHSNMKVMVRKMARTAVATAHAIQLQKPLMNL